ncbi:MAG: IS5 family transposase [bacterium]
MPRKKTWEISDAFWELVEPLIPTNPRVSNKTYQRQRGGGRKAKYSNRLYFSAMVYVLRTGIIWNALPREKFGGLSSSALHDKFQQWSLAGVFTKIWQRGLAEYDELQGISWTWEAADSSSIEAPLARESTGPNPTDRGKKRGSKRHLLVDENGVPISLLVSAANRHDSVVLESLLQAEVVSPMPATQRNLCLDAGYVGKEEVVQCHGFIPHIRPRGEEKQERATNPNFKARRWIVELTHSWFNRFRKLIPRYEKTDRSYQALTCLAAAMITLNKIMSIYG